MNRLRILSRSGVRSWSETESLRFENIFHIYACKFLSEINLLASISVYPPFTDFAILWLKQRFCCFLKNRNRRPRFSENAVLWHTLQAYINIVRNRGTLGKSSFTSRTIQEQSASSKLWWKIQAIEDYAATHLTRLSATPISQVGSNEINEWTYRTKSDRHFNFN